ncbi:unnamed protein product [Trichobilharzia szidati]|nr:unnamed protein product [Trichobilharzia szidati]
MGFKVYRPAQTNVSVWLKNSLIAHHMLFLVLMATLIGLACWLLIWTIRFSQFETILKTYYFSSGKLILLLSSIFGAGVVVFGYCIFNVESPMLLLIHIICTFILVAAFLSVSVCGYMLLLQLEYELPTKFTQAITKYYGVNMSLRRNVDITMTVDEIQFKFKCCGTYGQQSSNSSWYIYRKSSVWYLVTQEKASKSPLQYVPESCCVLKDKYFEFNSFTELQLKSDVFLDRDICVGYKSLSARDDIAPRIDNPGYITQSNAYLHEQGCITVVKQDYRQYAIMLAASGTTALVLSIIGLIISFALLSHIEYQQFIRISTEYGSCNITTNTELSARDNISIISKQTSNSDILVKA